MRVIQVHNRTPILPKPAESSTAGMLGTESQYTFSPLQRREPIQSSAVRLTRATLAGDLRYLSGCLTQPHVVG